MRKIFICLVLAAVSVNLLAASDFKGKVYDENGEALEFANVALLSSKDSTVIAGTTTASDGSFNIVTDAREGVIMVAMVGYRTQYLNPGQTDNIRMTPDNEILQGAVASAIMPKTNLTGEGLQTSVRGSVLETAGTANDVLSKTPGLIKGQNGLEVIGKGAPVIYINGRKITDKTELDRLQSNEIQNVEVISNPGAQYDAGVRSVVRIRTIKRQGEGFGFNLAITDDQSLRYQRIESPSADMMPDNDPNANVNMNYRIGGVDIFAGANIYKESSRQESDIMSETFGSPSFRNDGWVLNHTAQQILHLNSGVNWQIAETHSVGFKLDYGVNYAMTQYQRLHDSFRLDGSPYDETDTRGDYFNGDKSPYAVGANAYYNGQAGKLNIDFNFDFYRIYDSNRAEIQESSTQVGHDVTVKTESQAGNNLYASKLVFSYPVWKGMFSIGTEETFSRRADSYATEGTSILSASSDVIEDNVAAFANYAFYLPKFGQVSAGLRYEYVKYVYDDKSGTDDLTKTYSNVFPTVSYATALGPVQLMVNYSGKTARPGFNQLSSALRYNSKYILQSGNPALQPQTIQSASVMARWNWLVASVDYTRIDKLITSWSYRFDEVHDEGVMLVKPCNLDSPFRNLTAYVNFTPTVGIWNLNATLAVIQQWLTVDAPDPREPSGIRRISFSDHPMAVVQMNNTFSLKKDWQLELGGEYHSKGVTGNAFLLNDYYNLTFAVQKSLLKDKSLVIRLSGNDVLGLARFDVRSDYGGQHISQTNLMDTQRIKLSVRYRFNAAQSKYKGTGAGQEVIGRMK